jgi:glycosyltransferase involved in cell wall biosynthesis
MARVSVIVPTHNRRESVTEALDSIMAQTFREFEIVVTDDGSTDGTPSLIFETLGAEQEVIEYLNQLGPASLKPFSHKFSSRGVPIQYHYGISRGLSTARNRGIRMARGDYVAFLEADDLWEPTHLEALVAFLSDNPAAHVCRAAERTVRDGRARTSRKPVASSGWIFEAALEASPMSPSAVMVRRPCFAECGAFDENLPACDEYDLWVRMTSRYPVHFVQGPVVTRRSTRPDGSSRAWGWDRYRVYALEKAFQSGHLSPEQRFQVAQEIVRKCERLVDGFRRQKSEERANFYERKRRRFAHEVRKLRASRVAKVS